LSKWLNEKRLVLETARKLEDKGLVIGTAGNVSLRLVPENGRELLAITPTSRYYDTLSPDDIPVIDFKAEPVEGNLPPSSEAMLHIGIYKVRKDVGAVIHTHSIYASAMAVAHKEIPPIIDDQVTILGGTIKLAQYAPSGSDELAVNVIRALEDRNAVLMMNHGAVGAGKDLREALTVCELLEKTARVYYYSLTMGRPHLLSEKAIESGLAFFRMFHAEK
jgi:L-ribulose-5-phosphate 4-epimerase